MNMRAIARRAGVSSATVSRVINGSPLVREETAKRVQAILDQVNFIPNPVATTLKYGRSKTYGLFIPDIRNPFFAEFLAEFEELLVPRDHEVLLTTVSSTPELVKSVRRMLMRQVDGALLMASKFETKAIEPLFLHKIPLVTIDRRVALAGCSDVEIDFNTGYLQAVQHLQLLGHERVAFIGGTKGLETSSFRLNAFRSAVRKCGLTLHPNLVRIGDYRMTGGELAVASLMSENPRPTAIITVNDLTAFGVIRGLHGMGLSVPRDVSLIGLDDVLLCDVLQPPLTTIRIPRRQLAEVCIRALEYTKEDVERDGAQYSIPTELIVRESTAPVKRKSR